MKFLIILVVIIGLSAVFGAIIVGRNSFEGIVAEKPYDYGLLWDKEQKARADSGLHTEIMNKTFRVGENRLIIKLLDRERNVIKGAALTVLVSRPSTTVYDRRYDALPSSDNLYYSAVYLPLYGYWDVKLQVSEGRSTVSFEHKIYAME